MFQSEIVVALFLPLLLMYLLLFFRIIEGRQKSHEERHSGAQLALRDALLVTLALDLAEVVTEFGSGVEFSHIKLPLAISATLFVLHISFFFLLTTRVQERVSDIEPSDRISYRKMLDAYLALIVIMTNATTVGFLMQYLVQPL